MPDIRKIVEEAEEQKRLLRDAGVVGPAAEAARMERERKNLFGDPYLIHNAADANRQMEHVRAMQRDIADAREAPTARRAVANIAARIRAFEASLDAASEVGLNLVSFNAAMVVHIRELDYEQPNLIFFRGKLDNGSPVELIQHLTQLSFLLVRVPRLEPSKPRPVIGFNLGQNEREDEAN